MDAITHVLLAHALALLVVRAMRARAPHALAAAAGAAALAPDLDVFLAPLTMFPQLYFLSHRVATHSLIGAPAAALLFLLVLDRASRRFQRFALFRWRRGFLWAGLWGAWSHLLLDIVTRQGVVLFWPVSDARMSLEWFFYIIWWLAPFSLLGMVQRYRGKWRDVGYLRLVAVVVVVLLVVGGVRLAGRPSGDHVYATQSAFEWVVADEHENGSWSVHLVRGDATLDQTWYVPDVPEDAELAVVAARQSLAYRAFVVEGTGPFIAQAEPAPRGWNVTIVDAVARFQTRDLPGFVPERWVKDVGLFRATVGPQGVQVHSAGR